jgi:hypothetical protein
VTATSRLLAALILAGLAAFAANPAFAFNCPPAEGRDVRFFAGEAAGSNSFYIEIGPGWAFALVPRAPGWEIQLLDKNEAGDEVELSWATDARMSPSPRQIFGWHFRNADNTGTNLGDVNAPQHLRLFEFFPGNAAMQEVLSLDRPELNPQGRGALEIQDYGLADLEKGQQARMVYVKFSVCLSWPEGAGEVTPVVSDETIEIFGACGLHPPLRVTPILPIFEFEGDFDGDGAWDRAALISRDGDGKRGIAICRAGTWLDIVGISGDIGEFQPAYMESVDWWTLLPKGQVGANASGEAPPQLLGDAIVLGKEGSSSVLLYWDGKGIASYWQGD